MLLYCLLQFHLFSRLCSSLSLGSQSRQLSHISVICPGPIPTVGLSATSILPALGGSIIRNEPKETLDETAMEDGNGTPPAEEPPSQKTQKSTMESAFNSEKQEDIS